MIDTHCHLDKEFYSDINQVIQHMKNHMIIVSGTNIKDSKNVILLCKKYKNIYGTIGFHPDEIKTIDEKSFLFLEENLKNTKIVGVGEIGLDYYHNKENKEEQKELFIRQIKLAQKYNKTIVIHSRDAIEDTYEIVKKYGKGSKIVLHCYSGSVEMAYKFLKLGVAFGIGGVVTFKNSHKLKEVVKEMPLSSLLLETDSPFLTPEPYRGKTNEPYNVYYVAQEIAKIKEISVDKVIEETTKNAMNQFDFKENL